MEKGNKEEKKRYLLDKGKIANEVMGRRRKMFCELEKRKKEEQGRYLLDEEKNTNE